MFEVKISRADVEKFLREKLRDRTRSGHSFLHLLESPSAVSPEEAAKVSYLHYKYAALTQPLSDSVPELEEAEERTRRFRESAVEAAIDRVIERVLGPGEAKSESWLSQVKVPDELLAGPGWGWGNTVFTVKGFDTFPPGSTAPLKVRPDGTGEVSIRDKVAEISRRIEERKGVGQ